MSQALPLVLRGVPGAVLAAVLAVALPVDPVSAAQCVVQPTFSPNFAPALEWAWTGSAVMPNHKQVMMTPAVADVNGDGVPDVIFNSFAGSNYNTDGVLRAISGDDGHDLWAATDPQHRVRGASSVTVGDIDNDGLVEVCTIPQNGAGFICFEHDGTFKFRTTVGSNSWGGVSFADLQGDGTVEIINGHQVFSATGALLWTGIDGVGGHPGTGPVSFAADVDQDGLLEVVNGRAVYEHDGTLKWRNTSIGHGLAGVGNFDADAKGEVVVVWSGRVSLLDDGGALLWTAAIPGGGVGGAPNIADFDNDGQPEIGVAGANRYVVFETNGAVKWSSPVQDFSSNRTGSSTFDFEGDGKAEAVYADEKFLRIYDGTTGAIRFQVANPSGTTYENPVIADVDADGNAEIVVISNNYAFAGSNGVRVFRDAQDGWVNTRRIWNQHAYSVTNVNEDGTIPATPATNWLTAGLNTFRANSQGTGDTSAFAAPNLQVTALQSSCVGDTTTGVVTATVTNIGDAGASAGVPVAFYFGSAAAANLIEVVPISAVLGAGQSVNVAITLAPAPGGTQAVVAVADDDGTGAGGETECVETDNALALDLDLSCNANEPPVASCHDVTVAAGPQCTAPASIDAGSYDPDGDALTSEQSPVTFWLGMTAATLAVSDGEESASCQAQVTVVDETAPTVQCAAAIQVAAGTACSADVSGLLGVVTEDNCSVPNALTFTFDPPGGVVTGTGVHTVQVQVADESGNVATCQTQVTVVDLTPPALACPGNAALECTFGAADYDWTLGAPTDNCPGAVAACTVSAPASFGLGTTGVSCTAVDAAGNEATCGFDVAVADTLPPVLACSAAQTVECAAANGTAATTSATAEDLCDAAVAMSSDAPEAYPMGATAVTWSAVDGAGHTAQCQTTVTVVDTTAPTVTQVATMPLLWPPNHKYHTITAADCFAGAADTCAADADILATGVVLQAWSDEVEDAPETKGKPNGDGQTTDDILLSCGGGAAQLRAERAGGADGRVYTLVWGFTDPAGNLRTATCKVGVPHDQGGQATPVDSGNAYGETCQ